MTVAYEDIVPATQRRLSFPERAIPWWAESSRYCSLGLGCCQHFAQIWSATTEGVGGETFQIATNAETTVREIADRLIPALAEAGIKDVEVRHTDARRGEVRRNFADTSKAKRFLGWQAEMDLDEGLRRTVAWFVEDN